MVLVAVELITQDEIMLKERKSKKYAQILLVKQYAVEWHMIKNL